MKNVNRILIAVFFFVIVFLLIAFSSIYPFTALAFVWQCVICGFFGLLWIICILIEIRKKDIESNTKPH
jgi:hypothetical protein